MADFVNVKAEILERVAVLCHRLPAEVVESVCWKFEVSALGEGPDSIGAGLVGIAEPAVRAEIGDVASKWLASDPKTNLREFSQVLRGASAAERAARSRQDLELVWTGPSPHNSSFRRTEQALLEVIEAARKELWLVSFASYKVPEIGAALVAAAGRGIQIRLVLESKEDSEGALTLSALRGLGSKLADHASVYIWPRDRRAPDESGRRGVLHAKCAVADGNVLFVSSANLTGDAMTLNMEMGVLVRGAALPQRTADHLSWLVEQGILQAAPEM
jgi:phosphatidylserine/phosphatidylglycerophosphate/cardiolipin synthase-like enzyme